MLKARQAPRAKTANAAAEKGKENDRRDFAAVKELRQKMFEQQRQYVFLLHLHLFLLSISV